MMQRIKISDNFFLDEFIHPEIYSEFQERSRLFIRPEIIKIAQAIRNIFGPVYINNWSQNGRMSPQDFLHLPTQSQANYMHNSGLRVFNDNVGANHSPHKYGCAVDLHFINATPLQVRQYIAQNYPDLRDTGLRRMELETPTWVHLDCFNTGLNDLVTFKP